MTKRSSHCEEHSDEAILSSKQFSLIILSLLILFLFSGCLSTKFTHSLRNKNYQGHYVPVSFISQKGHRCGPAALAMVLNYWEKNITQKEIAKELYLPNLRGSLTFDLESYPRKFGLYSYSYQENLSELKEKLNKDVPMIVLLGTGSFFYRVYHYALVVGYWDEENMVVMHSGKEKDCLMRYNSFLEKWKVADCWALVVCPPEKITWSLSREESCNLARFYFDSANQDLEKELFEKAAARYRKAIKLNPEFADAYNNLAWVYYQQRKNLSEAINLVRKALKLNPAHKTYYLDTLKQIKKLKSAK